MPDERDHVGSPWHPMDEQEPPTEGIYLTLRVPYVGVAFWSSHRHLWYTVDTMQEQLDRGYVTYWAPLPQRGQDLTHLIEIDLSLPQLPPWYSHVAVLAVWDI